MTDNNIHKIDKKIQDILPMEPCCPKELNYSIIEEKKDDWTKLSEISHRIVLVFDCYTNIILVALYESAESKEFLSNIMGNYFTLFLLLLKYMIGF